MSRITSQAAHLSVGQEANFLSNAQLHLDASLEGFNHQATHAQSIAALSLAGIVGQGARLGFLSLGAGRVFAQLGSVGLEALSLAGMEHWNTPSHAASFSQSYVHSALNVAVFRIFSPFHAANPLLRQGIQASALVSAHHAAVWAGFEEKNTLSFTQEMTQALATNLTFHVGAGLGQFLLGGRLGLLQKSAEVQVNQRFQTISRESHTDQALATLSAQGGRRPRASTSLSDRVAPGAIRSTSVHNPRETLNEILVFSAELERVVRENLPVIETHHAHLGLGDILQAHRNLLPANTAESAGFFRRRLSEFKTAIQHYEQLQSGTPAERPVSAEATAPVPSAETVRPIPKIFSYFEWTRRLYLAVMERVSPLDTLALPDAPAEIPVTPEDLTTYREACAQIYDNLVLLQEALRITRQAQKNISDTDRPAWEALESSYQDLHEKLQERRVAFRRATTQFYQVDNEDFFRLWTQPFIDRTTNLRVSRNLQTLLGNVVLVQGEHVGGSIWGAIQKTQRAGQAFQSLRTFYDAESAQLVAFDDPRSPLSKKTVLNLRQRGRPLVTVNYIIDTAESGQIIDALIEAPVSENCSKIINGLIGLQLAKNDPIFAYSDVNPTKEGRMQLPRGARTYSLSNLTDYESRGHLYQVMNLTPRRGTDLFIVTLIPAQGTESDNAQLVLQRSAALRLPPVGGNIRLTRIEG